MQLFMSKWKSNCYCLYLPSKEKISSHGLPPETSSKTAGLIMPLSCSHASRCPHPEPHCSQNKKLQPDSHLLLLPCSQSTSSTVLQPIHKALSHTLCLFVRISIVAVVVGVWAFCCCLFVCFFLWLVVCLGEIVFV